jgi:hypothetical protein
LRPLAPVGWLPSASHSLRCTTDPDGGIGVAAQLLQDPDQRQPPGACLALVSAQQLTELVAPRAYPRQRLTARQIALIGFFCAKQARRIFAIASTTTIPQTGSHVPNGSHCAAARCSGRDVGEHIDRSACADCMRRILVLRPLIAA